MIAFLWLVALAISLVALAYLVSATVSSIRAGRPAYAATAFVLGVALAVVAFSRAHPLLVGAIAIGAGLTAAVLLRRVTRNPMHASQSTRLSAAHLALLAGSFLFLIPFAWLLST